MTRSRLFTLAAFLTIPLTAAAGFLHVPHDSVYGMAAKLHVDGTEEIVVVTVDKTVFSTRDGAMSWSLISGAGLEDAQPTAISYNETLPWLQATGGQGHFIIGTYFDGVYAYQPSDLGQGGTGVVRKFGGLGNVDVLAIASPTVDIGSPQPSFLLTMDGRFYRLKDSLKKWELVYDTGANNGGSGAIVMAPAFDKNGSGPNSLVAFSSGTQLYVSTQGGASGTFTQISQFDVFGNDWGITSLAVDTDFGTNPSARLYLGRTRKNGSRTDGELYVSDDDGSTWTTKMALDTGISSIACSDPSGGGSRHVFVAGRDYPNTNGYIDTGLMRSDDRGETFDDQGNWQSFLFENSPGERTGWKRLADNQVIVVLPEYATKGRVAYGRNEGLFLSEDEGFIWREYIMRAIDGMRGMTAGMLSNGAVRVYGASYGQGTIGKDISTGEEFIVQKNLTTIFQLPVTVSPNYANDGTVLAGGAKSMMAWYDPDVLPPQNPFNATGAKTMPLVDPVSGSRLNQYIRSIAFSPHYDGSGQTGDQIVYFGGYQQRMYYTTDGGETFELAATTAPGNGVLPYIQTLAIAPSFTSATPHNDVYGVGTDGNLWRLIDDVWTIIADVGDDPRGICFDPDWDPVFNRKLYVARKAGAPVVEVNDFLGGNPQLTNLNGMPTARGRGVEIVEDLSGDRWMYCATFSEGVWKRNMTAGTGWAQVSTDGFPATWVKAMKMSPDFANDRKIFLGSGQGVWSVADTGPGATWQREFSSYVIDNSISAVVTWVGPTGTAPDPNQPWPWITLREGSIPGGGFGPEALVAQVDDSYLMVRARGTKVTMYTLAGEKQGASPVRTGEITLSGIDPSDGSVIASTTVDLGALSTNLIPHEVELDLGVPSAVVFDVRVDISLDPTEAVLIDAFKIDY